MQHLKQPTFYPVRGRNIRWNTVATVAINPEKSTVTLVLQKPKKNWGQGAEMPPTRHMNTLKNQPSLL